MINILLDINTNQTKLTAGTNNTIHKISKTELKFSIQLTVNKSCS